MLQKFYKAIFTLLNMVKKILMFLIVSVFLLQTLSATFTNIHIKTPSFTETHLTVLDPDVTGFSALKGPTKKVSDYYGDVYFNYSGSETHFDLMVILKKNGQTISSKKYREYYTAGEDLYLEIIPDGYTLLETPNSTTTTNQNSNQTNTSSTNSTNSSTNSNETINSTGDTTGSVVGDSVGSSFFSKKGVKIFLYIIGAVFLLWIIAFFSLKTLQIKRPNKKIKVTKLSEVKNQEKEKEETPKDESDDNFKSVEEKLKKAQEELELIKKEQKIKEIKQKMKKDQEELERLSRR